MTDFEPLKKFSSHLKNCLLTAWEIASATGNEQLEPVHLLYGLLAEKGSLAGEFMASLKLSPAKIKSAMPNQLAGKPTATRVANYPIRIGETAEKIIVKAIKIAFTNNHKYVGTEHLLTALLQIPDQLTSEILKTARIPATNLLKQSETIINTTSKLNDILADFEDPAINKDNPGKADRANSALNFFGRNLTEEKIQAQLDPVIGRAKEIEQIIEILSRRQKNNPLLIGDPGVGKTAIIEGLAKKIYAGEVPEFLAGKKIYSLDLASVVAGTSFRGEFEARLKEIISEAENRNDAIIFIDEIHQLIGAGSASGSMDAANILKPALARGRVRIIGATTYQDYRKSIENDGALARRLQIIKIEEPSEAEAKQIIIGLKEYLENFHKINIADEAIEAAVTLSQRYIGDKLLPDKAIDLIDGAAARLKAGQKIKKSETDLKTALFSLRQIEQNLKELIIGEDFELAAETQLALKKAKQKISQLQQKVTQDKNKKCLTLGYDNIAAAISRQTGISLPLKKSEQIDFDRLEKKLNEEIIGQNEALGQILPYLKRASAGLNDARKPLASFIFAGPSGVGKTYTAAKIAEHFFGSAKNLIKINMSEYGEKFNASKLIGAPAGYVGYKESGELTEKIKRQPYSLILLDEIEKANPEIFDLFLQILDEGYLTDAVGAKINFQNSVIVMTSNLGSELFSRNKKLGFGEAENSGAPGHLVIKEIKKYLKPEFVNRLDKIVIFDDLNDQKLMAIAELELGKLLLKLKNKQTIEFNQELLAEIIRIKNSSLPSELGGARTIQKIIKEQIETILADKLLSHNNPSQAWRIAAKNGIITLT